MSKLIILFSKENFLSIYLSIFSLLSVSYINSIISLIINDKQKKNNKILKCYKEFK
jgi:hypothetical protein